MSLILGLSDSNVNIGVYDQELLSEQTTCWNVLQVTRLLQNYATLYSYML